jgi:hypothetical protein
MGTMGTGSGREEMGFNTFFLTTYMTSSTLQRDLDLVCISSQGVAYYSPHYEAYLGWKESAYLFTGCINMHLYVIQFPSCLSTHG